MIGDFLLIYDPDTDMFYAGREKFGKIYADKKSPPRWVLDSLHAKCSNALTRYGKIVREIGGNVRIVSETEARRIVMLREYREAQRG